MTRLCIYKYEKYLKYVNISWNGSIEFGNSFEIDGYSGRPVRVISHAHADHLNELGNSVRNSKYILATPETLDLVEYLGYVEKSLLHLLKTKAVGLKYYEEFKLGNETCTLLPADHIPGSAQVVVKIKDENIILGYTGDFKLTGKTDVIQNPSVLVIESTYGHPIHVRPYKSFIPQILVDLVLEGLRKYRRIYIYAYHGKMQEAMQILRNGGISEPFLLPDKVYELTALLERKYNYRIGNYYKEDEAIFTRTGVVVFKHFNLARKRKLDGSALHIILTGKLIGDAFRKIDDHTYVVSLSDHADFNEIVEYVERSSPELIVLDATRSDNAEVLGSILSQKGFCSIVMPTDR
ncbi:MAG: MBL fold metallo-hydrolase [Desulfurococcaceae archaeon]